ncbi:MarC family protein [Nitratifractor sp.]
MTPELVSTLLHDTIALITIFNPVAAAGLLVTMVSPPTPANIYPAAWKATLTIFIASLITLFTGEFLFKLFGINVYSIKVIGGIILMMIAVNMAYGQPTKARHTKEEQEEAQEKEDISIVPLGIPILFGPGVIATIIVLNHNNTHRYGTLLSYGLVTAAIVLSALTVYLILRYSGIINRALGVTGMKIMTRIMGLIVGAIAAQFLIGGVKGLWE